MISQNCQNCNAVYVNEPKLKSLEYFRECSNCGNSEKLPFVLTYQLLKELGSGGFGKVYLAWDTQLRRRVAIKFLIPKLEKDEIARERLIREARAAAPIQHPGICTVHVLNEENERPFIVMDYIEGETLQEYLKKRGRNPDDLRDLLDIATQVTDALAAAHEIGILHRDIKPSNIMITRNGEVKVMDFGLAKLVPDLPEIAEDFQAEIPLTDDDVIMGTWAYMSPEQFDRQYMPPEQFERHKLDHRSDIFSLGIVLYEMFTGIHPFFKGAMWPTLFSILNDAPAPLKDHAPWIPDKLQEIVFKALSKNRDDRYQTTQALSDDLFEIDLEPSKPDETLDETKIIPVLPVPPTPPRSAVRHKNLFVAFAIASSLAILIVAFLILRASFIATETKTIAVLPLTNANKNSIPEFLSDGIIESIIGSLSKQSDIRVIQWNTVSQYKDKQLNHKEIGRELGASEVLTGKISQEEDSLTLETSLISISDGSQFDLTYRGKVYDFIGTAPKQITKDIYSKLTGKEINFPPSSDTENSDARLAYLNGRYSWNKRTGEDLTQAIDHFQEAIRLDPDYAAAYAGLADCYNLQSIYSDTPPDVSFRNAKAAAMKALELNEGLAEAHTSLAFTLYRYEWNFAEADKEFKRAIELNPNYETAHHWYGEFLLPMGLEQDAIRELELALRRSPMSHIIRADLGATYIWLRKPDQAIEHAQRTLKSEKRFSYAYGVLALAYEQKGMYKEALEELEEQARLLGERKAILPSIARIHAKSGNREKALLILNKITDQSKKKHIKKHRIPSYDIALIYVALGQKDEAFKWLKKASEERSDRLIWITIDPRLDSIKNDPRFADLVKFVGLRS